MKKTKIISLILFIGVILILTSCLTGFFKRNYLPSEELIIAPDPDNSFQGTWMSVLPDGFMHVINGMNGEWYARMKRGDTFIWEKRIVYTIEENDNGYITSNNWPISVNNDTLTVEGMQYIRYDRWIEK